MSLEDPVTLRICEVVIVHLADYTGVVQTALPDLRY
jgi:hypothetical protein